MFERSRLRRFIGVFGCEEEEESFWGGRGLGVVEEGGGGDA